MHLTSQTKCETSFRKALSSFLSEVLLAFILICYTFITSVLVLEMAIKCTLFKNLKVTVLFSSFSRAE